MNPSSHNLSACPRLSDWIIVKNPGDDHRVAIIHRDTGTVIAAVGQEELAILSCCTGTLPMAAILERFPDLTIDDLAGFLEQLADQKIIEFH